MAAVVQGGPIQQNFIGCTTKKMSLSSMKKMDLLSLFFFDPLHQTDEESLSHTILDTKQEDNKDNDNNTLEQISEISEEQHTDPADLSSNESLNENFLDTSSNTTDCEPLWCGCSSSCFCEEEWWASYSSEEPRNNWEDKEEEREMLTWREIECLELADDWERMQRGKTQRNVNILRAKRTEKKDKVWANSFVKAIIQKKRDNKQAIVSDHFERQRQNSTKSVSCFTRFGVSHSSSSSSSSHHDESAEVQRAIALSSPASSSSRNNVLACGLTQQQLNDLMNRELTPEDYELLLTLDESVKKKTVGKSALDSFASRSVTSADVEESACTIS